MTILNIVVMDLNVLKYSKIQKEQTKKLEKMLVSMDLVKVPYMMLLQMSVFVLQVMNGTAEI